MPPDTEIPGLLVRYPMDDDPSSGHVHSTVAAYDGTCTACPRAVAGHLAGGYTFDGTKSIELPAVSAGLVGPSVPYTVTMWARPQSNGPRAALVSKPISATSTPNAMKVYLATPPGDIVVETTNAATQYDYLEPMQPALVGGWHHIAASWDGAMKRLYIDGVFVGAETTPGLDSSLAVVIGADLDNGALSTFYLGELDDMRFYGRALADSEVASLAAM